MKNPPTHYQDMNDFFKRMLKEENHWKELNNPSNSQHYCVGGFGEANMDYRDEPQSYDQIRGE
jgi:hypothetical protein